MWKRIKSLFASDKAPVPQAAAMPRSGISHLFTSTGKLKAQALRSLAAESSVADFLLLINFPVLVGSSVHEGTLAPRQRKDPRLPSDRQHTHLFKADDIRQLVEGASLEHSIFPVLRGPASESTDMYRFTVGRGATNDIVMNDFAVSETHAYIMVARHGYAVADLNSTNGTKLNGAPVGQNPSSLKDGDKITFGRYDFTFRTPPGLHDFLTSKGSDL